MLANVYDRYQAEIIKSILSQEGIPVLEKSKGSGAYTEILLGRPGTGIDLYVPNFQLAEARDMINTLTIASDNIDENIDYSPKDINEKRSVKGLKRWFLFLIVIPVIATLVYALGGIMKTIYQTLID